VHVRVDQTRHDDPASRIHKLVVGILLPQAGGTANLNNQAILDGNAPVFNQGQVIILSDQTSIPNQQHERYPPLRVDSSERIVARHVIPITV
jgi:hypothetical protein